MSPAQAPVSRRRMLDASGVGAAVDRLVDAVVEEMRCQAGDWAIVAIRTGGDHLADRLADRVAAQGLRRPARGELDITLYRDDLYTGLEKPVLGATELPFEVTGSSILLVDDVLFTGRTVRAALDEIYDFGRPTVVRLCVLVDRGHRELPIAPDFVGLQVGVSRRDRVVVELGKVPDADAVWVESP